jgi:hypothetical protein
MIFKVLGSTQRQALADMCQEDIPDDIAMVDGDGVMEDCPEEWVDVTDDEAFARALEETSTRRSGYSANYSVSLLTLSSGRPRYYKDGRTWRQRLTRIQANWAPFLDSMTLAFLRWKYPDNVGSVNVAPPSPSGDSTMNDTTLAFEVETIDLYNLTMVATITRSGNATVAESLVQNGWLGASPINPSIAISLKTLELFRRLRLRKASFSVEAFAKVLCDLYSV